MLVKLKMLTTGPNKNYRVGARVEVDELRAALLLKGKHAAKDDGRDDKLPVPAVPLEPTEEPTDKEPEEVTDGDDTRLQGRKAVHGSV